MIVGARMSYTAILLDGIEFWLFFIYLFLFFLLVRIEV
jgi:hypothetical protein